MDANTNPKAKLPSRYVTEGPQRAPHRSYYYREVIADSVELTMRGLVAASIRPRDIVTRRALENAAAVVAASGGSTNAALHLPAIAHECAIEFNLLDVAEVFRRTPCIADLKLGGRYVAKDLFEKKCYADI